MFSHPKVFSTIGYALIVIFWKLDCLLVIKLKFQSCHPHFANHWSKRVEELIEQTILANRYPAMSEQQQKQQPTTSPKQDANASFFRQQQAEERRKIVPCSIVAIGECGLDNSVK
jgi:hypothetical protein